MVSLDSLISFHRRQAGLSQIELAELAGVSRRVVQSVESGQTGISWRNLCAILRTLNVTLTPEGPLVDAWKETVLAKTTTEQDG
jgi:HTH-type transcriptional regulator / antitoxin HipB